MTGKYKATLALVSAMTIGWGLVGCEVGSSSTAARQTLAVSGVYRDPKGGRIVDRQSGAVVRVLSLRQLGDQIEAVDNNGRLFRGRFTAESDAQGVLELRGDTTTGVPVIIQGSIRLSGAKAYLRGTWIEPALLGIVTAEADIIGAPTPPSTTNTTAVATN